MPTPDHSEENAKATLGAGALVTFENKVLLVQLNYGRFKGHWILPGGMVQPDEHPKTCAIRETKEETGVDIEITHLLAVRNRIYEDNTHNSYFVFRAKELSKEPQLTWPEDELLSARFWPLEQALEDKMIRPLTQNFLRLRSVKGFRELNFDSEFTDSIFGG